VVLDARQRQGQQRCVVSPRRFLGWPVVGRVLFLRANRNTGFNLPAARTTTISCRANRSTFYLGASLVSITSNLSFFRGEDVTLNFQMGPPLVDITGWTITWKLASTLGGTVQFAKTATIVDGPRGQFKVTVASGDTASLSVGRYVWDCRRTDSGNKATLADGYLDLKQEVTA
jgi:hypothetical protein